MFPDSNAPKEANPWVRIATERAQSVQNAAARLERNAYAFAASTKDAMASISNRVQNVGSLTTGLFEQENHYASVTSFAQMDALPKLYASDSVNYRTAVAVTKRIPFAKYNELTVNVDGHISLWTTASGTSGFATTTRNCIPIVQATIPPIGMITSNGNYNPNGFNYASDWTVERFESFANYDIPGNVVPAAWGSRYDIASVGYHPEFSSSSTIQLADDGWTGYSMRYTRQWLMEYMQAVTDYTTVNFPPPAGGRYLPPDVNRVEIILGWHFLSYINATPSPFLFINSPGTNLFAENTFSSEGVRNLGY